MAALMDRPARRPGATRRYVIHRTGPTEFLLLWRNGEWTVEQNDSGSPWRTFTLQEFESSDVGKRLAAQLERALHEAETDA